MLPEIPSFSESDEEESENGEDEDENDFMNGRSPAEDTINRGGGISLSS